MSRFALLAVYSENLDIDALSSMLDVLLGDCWSWLRFDCLDHLVAVSGSDCIEYLLIIVFFGDS